MNQVVSYRLGEIRRRRGMTQNEVADRLSEFTGKRLPQASISAMERGFLGERQRRFDAHELYLLAQVFEVPMVYFLIPPPGVAEIVGTGPAAGLVAALIGRDDQLAVVDDALAELGVDEQDPSHFRRWRPQRLYYLAGELHRVVEKLVGDLGRVLRETAVNAYLSPSTADRTTPLPRGEKGSREDDRCILP